MFNKELIKELINIKSEIEKYDEKYLYKQIHPNLPASEESIEEVEKKLGFMLNEEYKGFLKVANGWTNFHQTVNLFGTGDLVNSALYTYARQGLKDLLDEAIEETGFSKDDLLPIAATTEDMDIFFLTKPCSKEPGIIIWFTAYEIERYTDFNEFFCAMIEYNKMVLDLIKNEKLKL